MRQHDRLAATDEEREVVDEAVAPARPVIRLEDRAEAIRVRSYYAWVAAGRPPGDGVAFWLLTERELGPHEGEWDTDGQPTGVGG